jgi:hypothetical protein
MLRSVHQASTTPQRQSSQWSRTFFSVLLVLGIFATLNTIVADPAPADHGSVVAMVDSGGSMDTPPADTAFGSTQIDQSTGTPGHGNGMSMSECCGLLMLCIAIAMGIGALTLARMPRTGRARVLWQRPAPHTVTLGRALAPLFSSSPLQRTAVLRI